MNINKDKEVKKRKDLGATEEAEEVPPEAVPKQDETKATEHNAQSPEYSNIESPTYASIESPKHANMDTTSLDTSKFYNFDLELHPYGTLDYEPDDAARSPEGRVSWTSQTPR